jgi:hypothetical protein
MKINVVRRELEENAGIAALHAATEASVCPALGTGNQSGEERRVLDSFPMVLTQIWQ